LAPISSEDFSSEAELSELTALLGHAPRSDDAFAKEQLAAWNRS
jgi:hypothetical protein